MPTVPSASMSTRLGLIGRNLRADENLAVVTLKPYPRIAAKPFALLKGTRRNEPYGGNFFWRRICDSAFIIVEDGLFFLEPLAEFSEVGADNLMRLAFGPPGQWRLEHLALRQSGAPHVGKLAAIVEFHRDRKMVMVY